ncbi:hypothetical protein TRAPUB_1297 [Trametes pubescens]|uniref:BTB domain-containing protein n=1 Tax=Trametes pubescens TaxID=154538 RepID=A0A1M2VJP0_TRAPU|nr:hypothetical protein TRAPUB_1297 [Trametes pubescens]
MENAAVIEQDADLWFSDGSIVVIAEGTGFRVHMSLLSRSSPILRDIFTLPQPVPAASLGGDNAFGGVPVVHVSDSAYDMRCLLRTIYDGRKYLADMGRELPFSILSALMRLGHKYELTDIVDEAAQYLEEFFTADFDVWLQICHTDTVPTRFEFRRDEDDEAELFESVRLLRLTGKTAMLPMALYRCAQLGLTEILWGVERHTPGTFERLSDEDIEICVHASARLMQLSGHAVAALTRAECAAQCTSREDCSQRIRLFTMAVAKRTSGLITPHALAELEYRLRFIATLDCWKGLCDACRDGILERHTATQRAIWERMPSIFGFKPEELGAEWAGCSTSWITVTGSTTGFGRLLTELILKNGEKVVATARRPHALADLAVQYPTSQLLVVQLDVNDWQQIPAAFAQAQAAFGRLDVVVNNAAWGVLDEVESMPDSDVRAMFETNVWGAANVSREAVRFFREVNVPACGRLLQISSLAGFCGGPSLGYYAASKHALQITLIEPGGFLTEGPDKVIWPPQPAAYANPDLPVSRIRKAMDTALIPGDAKKAVDAFYKIAALEEPPLRVPLGKDSVAALRRKIASLTADLDKYEYLSEDLEVDE